MRYLIFLLFCASTAHAAPADLFCTKLLRENPTFSAEDFKSVFDRGFGQQIPLEKLLAIFKNLAHETGSCVGASADDAGLNLRTDKGYLVSLVATHKNGLIIDLGLKSLDDPHIAIHSWADVGKALGTLEGDTGATLKTEDNVIDLKQNSGKVFAIGSTFKLYVLGALFTQIEAGLHHWDEELEIRDNWKSLGVTAMVPGAKYKLRDIAASMIAISDNTAADHLLYTLGRENVERILKPMGNGHAEKNIPFLSTLEMFKLKWALRQEYTNQYVQDDLIHKREMLERLASVPRGKIGKNGFSTARPHEISTLEWFGTTEDTCNAMFWLGQHNSPELNKILSKVTPLVDVENWKFVGYKGGSEAGVISMTYLLESKTGNRACLSMSWNNRFTALAEYRFMDVVGKVLKFAAGEIR